MRDLNKAGSGGAAVAGNDRRPPAVPLFAPARKEPLAALGALVAAVALAGCSGPASAVDPRGPGAGRIAALWWLLLGVSAAVYLIVLATTAWAVRRRVPARPAGWPEFWPRVGVIAGGLVLPLIVLPVLCVISVRAMAALVAPAPAALVVEVRAHQWWWELRYHAPAGSEPFTTANELHVPVGRRVELRLYSADVIHSLWVPALQGKLDLIPGKTNTTWLQADRSGIYQGPCAEYCGIQHAHMALTVIAQPPGEFESWLEAQRRPVEPTTDESRRRGEQLFFVHCAHCHAVRGTAAVFGRAGPDLTHVASRRTLGAGALVNAKGSLAGWIADPQTLKPGNRMPRVPLPSEDFHAVVDYVASLR